MTFSKKKFYFLNWILTAPVTHQLDATKGNEVIQIYIQDMDGCRNVKDYTLPITQAGLSFAALKVHLLYPNTKCSNKAQRILVKIRILRGTQEQVIYTNDFILLAPQHINPNILQIPIYRIWYEDDYYNTVLANLFS
ncbi:unnamed protein product [Rotaria magnacalcarata]|uniref:Uncharacterized protein n=2 Tax=Rotaria magnacalcarata TaxID=392030 RepID=A0A816XFM9_9BILA|nr:unnamed protein product [Rotaria magnacalcarata]CAF2127000.1 unnamed protein product [Rotaria magnacalcarata]CAF2144873.1 unnamed protein product [Rotaria magnacalcarata]CAF4189566.1 unnamed protein product [Rotaria magnacalcarata]CAF4689114.1 unnamed protein product [Rotaria magnacalcarata]